MSEQNEKKTELSNAPSTADLTERPSVIPEEYPQAKESEVKTKADDHYRHLWEFNRAVTGTRKKPDASYQEFRKKCADLNDADSTPENIVKMRSAGLDTSKISADPIEKHRLLSSMFMRMESADLDALHMNTVDKKTLDQAQLIYRIDFKGNSLAERFIGLGDLLPPHVERVMVLGPGGQILTNGATRKINQETKRTGYFDDISGHYIPVHSGYKVVVLDSIGKEDISGKESITVQRRALMESHTLAKVEVQRKNTGELKGFPGKSQSHEFYREEEEQRPIKTKSEAQPKPEEVTYSTADNAKDESGETRRLKNLKGRIPKEVTQIADRILKQNNPLGTTQIFEVDGKRYAFRDETHCHAQTDRVRPSLKRPHHGVTAYEVA